MTALNRWRGSSVAAILFGALLLAWLTAENVPPADAEAETPALTPDLAKIPSDAIFFASGRVADLWNSDLGKAVRQKLGKEINEPASQFEKEFGLPLDQVERLTLVFLNASGSAEPLVFVGTTKAYDRDKVIAGGVKGKEEKYKGQTLHVKGKMAIFPLSERALVYGKVGDIHALIDHPVKNDGNLAAALRLAAGKHSLVCAVNVKAINDEVGENVPGELEPFKPILKALNGTLTVDVGMEMRAEVKVNFADEKSAKAAAQPARAGLDLGRTVFDRGLDQLSNEKEMGKIVDLLKKIQGVMKAVQVEQQGKTLQAEARLKIDPSNAITVVMEAVQKVRGAAAAAQGQNNLRQIAIAMHNYHDTMGRFPPQATYNKDGKPMLSWRVTILPYLEQQSLYNQFRQNEAWDSEHNKKLLARMPRTYASPEDDKATKEHATHYQGFVGKGAFFEGKQGIQIQQITDGTSNTIMIVEASKAVPWTKPEDVPFDPAKPLPKLGLPGAARFLASLCDGSVRMISHKIRKATLQNAITRDDGNPLGDDW